MTTALAEMSVPLPARRDPVSYLAEMRGAAPGLRDRSDVVRRLALIEAVQTYHARFGKQAEPVLRAAFATRLTHERRLGELLKPTGETRVIRDDRGRIEAHEDTLPDGVSKNLSSNCQALAAAPRAWFDEVVAGVLGGKRRQAVREIYLQARRQSADQDRVEFPEGLICGDFREAGEQVPDESVALIFTDPPYDRASLPLYGALAEFSGRALAPGGSLLVYAPNYALPQVFALMEGHLRFWWLIALVYDGGGRTLMREYGIRVAWKPLLWFVKGGRLNKQAIVSDVILKPQEKTEHEWQQSQTEANALIEALTAPGDLVVDPMCGSGTTLVAAQQSGRRWCGIDADQAALAIAAERIRSAKEE
jgi:hypothetical protein